MAKKPDLYPQIPMPFDVSDAFVKARIKGLDEWLRRQDEKQERNAYLYRIIWKQFEDPYVKCTWCLWEMPVGYTWGCILQRTKDTILLCSHCRKRLWNEVGHRVGLWGR